MSTRELLVLQCPAGGGHKSAAMAVAERASARGIPVRVLDVLSFAPPWFARLYVDAHLRSSAYLPDLYGTAYFASNHRAPAPRHPLASQNDLRHRFDQWIAGPLLDEVRAARPIAVVTTHFFPMVLLARARLDQSLKSPLVEVVTDYATHAFWAEPGADAYCAAPGRASAELARHGIDRARIFSTGIPVRTGFSSVAPLSALGTQPLRVLVTSGGFGVGPVTEVLRSFAGMPNVRLTVVCGDNPHLVERASRVALREGLSAEIIGFERNMVGRIAENHLVVTKPGGLTVTECLVAGRPMVLVGAVPGQESLNEAWVTAQGAAASATPCEVGRTVRAISERLAAMGELGRTLAVADAADRIVDVALARGRALALSRAGGRTREFAEEDALA